jgi:hypothetical protein
VEALPEQLHAVSITELAELLGLDKSSASRRVRQALELGYLINDETRHGYPARVRRGLPMPAEVVLLPTVETLQRILDGVDLAPPPDEDPAPDVEAQTALDHDPNQDGGQAQAPPASLEEQVDMAVVQGLRDRHPDLHDWPFDEVVKQAPQLLEQEAQAAREREARE